MLEDNSHADALALTNGSRGGSGANGHAKGTHDNEIHEIEISSAPAGRNIRPKHADVRVCVRVRVRVRVRVGFGDGAAATILSMLPQCLYVYLCTHTHTHPNRHCSCYHS